MLKKPLNAVGPIIRRLRVAQNISQEVLASRIGEVGWGLSRATLGQIEAQLRGLRDYELLVIARALKVDAARLLPEKKELAQALRTFWPAATE